MATIASPFLSVDDMLMGEILMSLKQDSIVTRSAPTSEPRRPRYCNNMTGLSVEVTPPSTDSPADVFSLDAFQSVSPLAYHPVQPLSPAGVLPSPPTTVTPRGSSKRYGPVVQLEDLRECFNMPIAAVARKFGICATLLKKICRRHGIQRWPHRQIRSLQKSIDLLRESLRVAKGTNKDYIAKKIAAFEYTLKCIMQDPNTAAKGISAGHLASPATEEMIKRETRAKNRKKAAASALTRTSLSDFEEAAKARVASCQVEPSTQEWTHSGAAGERLNTRRASVPMSLHSILC